MCGLNNLRSKNILFLRTEVQYNIIYNLHVIIYFQKQGLQKGAVAENPPGAGPTRARRRPGPAADVTSRRYSSVPVAPSRYTPRKEALLSQYKTVLELFSLPVKPVPAGV